MENNLAISGILVITEENSIKLKNTIRIYREVCNHISNIAYDESCFNSIALHHLTYKSIRSQYDIPANFAIRARDRVVSIYKKKRKKKHVFKSLSIDLDNRLLSISSDGEVIASIATINKRIRAKLSVDDPSKKELLKQPIAKARITLKSNEFFITIVVRPRNSINIIE